MAEMHGGDKFEAALREIALGVGRGAVARIGFLEGATYPDGKPVAMIALIQDGGAPGAGIPPRPFFRNMIAKHQAEWPAAIAALIVENNYNVAIALDIAAEAIEGQLKQSILDTNSPPLAASTIQRKGFAKPLIHTSNMINSTGHETRSL